MTDSTNLGLDAGENYIPYLQVSLEDAMSKWTVTRDDGDADEVALLVAMLASVGVEPTHPEFQYTVSKETKAIMLGGAIAALQSITVDDDPSFKWDRISAAVEALLVMDHYGVEVDTVSLVLAGLGTRPQCTDLRAELQAWHDALDRRFKASRTLLAATAFEDGEGVEG